MNEPNKQFRTVLIDILDHLGANERKKLSFLLSEDIERSIIDDPTIGGTLNIFQQLFDRRKISEENFTYLIAAFEAIKCYQATKSLRELQQRILKTRSPSNSDNNVTSTADTSSNSRCLQFTTSSGSSFVDDLMKDMEDDKIATTHISHMTQELHQINTNNTNIPISVMSMVTPVTKAENIHSGPHSINIGINKFRGIYCNRKRLIILSLGFILMISATIAVIIYLFFSNDPDPHPPPKLDLNDGRCKLPRDNSCTMATPMPTRAEGLGVYYEEPCYGVGCGFFRPYCRLCWIDPKAPGKMDRPQCPPCVSVVLSKFS
ncbi:unnamed protein product [Rotaria socialis]|uniref:DED domain-containing protein n=1 Tax=Rotaria socialis TaxID=392032 RepID=A0A820I8I9_9BILA|nr:unnamed protein product [Rotaria socialis]CAF3372333.1 unnamed protein product [Rotaria socialis]CAF3459909.1 unnamed protein product [Rotaria socialis]CAF4304792.1 unnamed protein product [Rotaria socialis]CAF4453408.1 unnamed protein product [Rotaria socialis]